MKEEIITKEEPIAVDIKTDEGEIIIKKNQSTWLDVCDSQMTQHLFCL